MGYKIASSKQNIEERKKDVPTFYEGFLLQWINPKAWIACVSGASIFSSTANYSSLLIFTCIYFMVCYVSLLAWAILGYRISFLLKNYVCLRLFNCSMGLLLIITTGYLCYTCFH
jgi:threonine/homoserine/homoserine lactone efflux protein